MTVQGIAIGKRYYRPTRTASHFEAVRPCSLELVPGSITEITGRSGSGKSTLLYMMAGLLQPSGGMVTVDGSDIYAMDDRERSLLRNRRMGLVPQGQTGLFALSVLDNVTLPAMLYGDSSACEGRARELLGQLGMAHLEKSRVAELSGGELRRLAVARALVMEPKVLFADEPTDDLDDENSKLVLQMIRSCADSGAAVLLVTHEAEAAFYADRLFRMDAGSLNPL